MPVTVADISSCELPAWVSRWVPHSGEALLGGHHDDIVLAAWRKREVALIKVVVRDLKDSHLSERVTQMYGRAFQALDDLDTPHLWRCWHYVPGIHRQVTMGEDRYMHFNAGRHAAYVARFGGEALGAQLPAATAVGWVGDDLVCHILAGRAPGSGVENPRQIPAYCYSSRYGPLPPCFARGTIVAHGHAQILLLAGTASVVGEDTRHDNDLAAQLHELCANLQVMCASAGATMSSLRAYVRHRADAAAVASALMDAFPRVRRIERMIADICRPDLLVEVEGVARIS